MKRIHSVKKTLRNILPSSDKRPAVPPAPSHPVITIKHLYAIDPQGTLVKYPGPLISLQPSPYTGGDLRYSTDGSLAYQAALTDLIRTAKMTLLFADEQSAAAAAASSASASTSWRAAKLQAEVAYYDVGADNRVECKMLPLLNIQQSEQAALDIPGSAFFDMDTGKFSRELMAASATWGVNLALLVRWQQPGRRQGSRKPLPSLPTADDGESTIVDDRRRRASADTICTIWPGPNAPR
ncbi:hypothetical protein N0V82_007125 [Gnomoniopsis sp. IMI 355080]|nr:hypothetical protein N0V82_007125 [Gnomoniopsis sp. IMI 355080]